MLSTKNNEKTTMMLEEFSKLTGFTPDQDYYYLFIEKEYMNSKENWKNIIEYMEEKEDLDNEDS